MCSSCNESDTTGDIGEMGKKLALEVEKFIIENCLEGSLFRVSFIGYSLGGVIIRAALPFLEKYK